MRTALSRAICVLAVVAMAGASVIGCGAAPDKQQEPTPEQKSAPGSGAVLEPDTTS